MNRPSQRSAQISAGLYVVGAFVTGVVGNGVEVAAAFLACANVWFAALWLDDRRNG